jgi:hypothetical protein
MQTYARPVGVSWGKEYQLEGQDKGIQSRGTLTSTKVDMVVASAIAPGSRGQAGRFLKLDVYRSNGYLTPILQLRHDAA